VREILFRGKREDNGNWITGSFHKRIDGCFIIPLPIVTSRSKVIPDTVGQYTGLCDKNGKKVFEGDIIYGINWMDRERIYQIIYEDSGFYCVNDSETYFHPDHITDMTVVGNIHDNPELLKGE
jgi:uncharacterized phage protein (TIGR01671 family)